MRYKVPGCSAEHRPVPWRALVTRVWLRRGGPEGPPPPVGHRPTGVGSPSTAVGYATAAVGCPNPTAHDLQPSFVGRRTKRNIMWGEGGTSGLPAAVGSHALNRPPNRCHSHPATAPNRFPATGGRSSYNRPQPLSSNWGAVII